MNNTNGYYTPFLLRIASNLFINPKDVSLKFKILLVNVEETLKLLKIWL